MNRSSSAVVNSRPYASSARVTARWLRPTRYDQFGAGNGIFLDFSEREKTIRRNHDEHRFFYVAHHIGGYDKKNISRPYDNKVDQKNREYNLNVCLDRDVRASPAED
jgi:hypothetical protein